MSNFLLIWPLWPKLAYSLEIKYTLHLSTPNTYLIKIVQIKMCTIYLYLNRLTNKLDIFLFSIYF